jgi:DNA-binding Xre family transcriptional regulator
MSFHWNLRRELFLRKNVHRAVDLQALLSEHGLPRSLPAVCALLKRPPESLPLRTMQVICNALGCNLNDFCVMEPDLNGRSSNGGDPSDPPDGEFPDPFQFPIHECE